MRRQRQRRFFGNRVAWMAVAFWGLFPVPLMLPLQRVEAQQAADIAPPMSSMQADEQIASLLRQIETLLDQGDVATPAGDKVPELFARALVLSSNASPAGQRTMAEFPSALKSRADAERAAGHVDRSARIEIFAEVASSVIDSHDALARGDAAPATQSGDATVITGAAAPAARRAAAADRAAPLVSGETSRRDVGASPSEAITDTGSPRPIAQHVPPAARENGSPASSGGQPNVETAKGSGGSQIATPLLAAAAPVASPDGIAAIPEATKVPPPSAAMVDALLKQGKARLSLGDVLAARLLFARAAAYGSGEAALALGDTYNSVFLAEYGVVGPKADQELAIRWYRKANAFGEPRARERLTELVGDTMLKPRDR